MRRGQAALEFLTTYGWAFMVILITIGALGYFGVLNPQQFIPDRCLLQQEFECVDYQATTDDPDPGAVTLRFYLGNNLGTAVTVLGVSATAVDTTDDVMVACTGDRRAGGDTLSSDGELERVCEFLGVGNLAGSGEKARFDINMTYREVGGRYNHTASGEVFVTLN